MFCSIGINYYKKQLWWVTLLWHFSSLRNWDQYMTALSYLLNCYCEYKEHSYLWYGPVYKVLASWEQRDTNSNILGIFSKSVFKISILLKNWTLNIYCRHFCKSLLSTVAIQKRLGTKWQEKNVVWSSSHMNSWKIESNVLTKRLGWPVRMKWFVLVMQLAKWCDSFTSSGVLVLYSSASTWLVVAYMFSRCF